MVQHMQIKKWDTQHQQMKANNHKINSIDSGKAFDILQQYFMIKKPQTDLSIEGTYHKIIKAVRNKPTVNIILSGGKLKALFLRSGLSQGFPLLSLSC